MKYKEKASFDVQNISVTTNVFKHLSKEEIENLDYVHSCKIYKKGDIVYKEGTSPMGVYSVIRGIVKLFKTGIEGREQIIRFAKKGDIIAYRSVLSSQMACTTAKVIEDAEICFIPAKEFLHILDTNKDVSIDLMKLACEQLNRSNAFITDIAQKNVRERLAEILIILKDDFGLDDNNVLRISLSREELANIAGTATESVIRLLSEFKEDKMIALSGRKITFLDEPRLKKTANM